MSDFNRWVWREGEVMPAVETGKHTVWRRVEYDGRIMMVAECAGVPENEIITAIGNATSKKVEGIIPPEEPDPFALDKEFSGKEGLIAVLLAAVEASLEARIQERRIHDGKTVDDQAFYALVESFTLDDPRVAGIDSGLVTVREKIGDLYPLAEKIRTGQNMTYKSIKKCLAQVNYLEAGFLMMRKEWEKALDRIYEGRGQAGDLRLNQVLDFNSLEADVYMSQAMLELKKMNRHVGIREWFSKERKGELAMAKLAYGDLLEDAIRVLTRDYHLEHDQAPDSEIRLRLMVQRIRAIANRLSAIQYDKLNTEGQTKVYDWIMMAAQDAKVILGDIRCGKLPATSDLSYQVLPEVMSIDKYCKTIKTSRMMAGEFRLQDVDIDFAQGGIRAADSMTDLGLGVLREKKQNLLELWSGMVRSRSNS